jgi:hypothetical protein
MNGAKMLSTVLDEASHLLEELVEFERELQVILPYAESRWPDYSRHFPYTSYGFVMVAFSKVDLYGQYWFYAGGSQHKRMQSFLRTYLGYPEKESDIAIHLWPSGVRSKAANGDQVKTGQRMWPGTWFFYPIFS